MSARMRMRQLLDRESMILSAGSYDALSAIIIERCGFDAIYTSGSGISASYLGLPDAGFLDFTTDLAITRQMVRSVSIPIVADVDTGFGDVASVIHTVREFESIGAAGVVLEDQISPKRCPQITESVAVIPRDEAVAKVRAAVEARRDRDFLILARTDSAGDEVYRRAEAFARVGADLVLPITRSFETADAYAEFIRKSPLPVCVNVSGWVARQFGIQDLVDLGCKWANVPSLALRAAVGGMIQVLEPFVRTRDVPTAFEQIGRYPRYEDLVGADALQELERRYAAAGAADS